MMAAVAFGGWLNTAAVIRAADVPDAWITATTKIALLTAEDVSTTNLNVDTVNGVVTVRGTVPTDLQKFNAGHTAMKVRGVTAVNNLLQIVPNSQKAVVKRSDEQVKQGVEAAFRSNARVKDSGIRVASVDTGVVLLSGKTSSLLAHLVSVQVANAVRGVRRVSSAVEVQADRSR